MNAIDCCWMRKILVEQFDCNSIGVYMWCCLCVIMLWTKQHIFASIFDIIRICYTSLHAVPRNPKQKLALKTLSKANLTVSIEILCHTPNELHENFYCYYCGLETFRKCFPCCFSPFTSLRFEAFRFSRVWALIKHVYTICLQMRDLFVQFCFVAFGQNIYNVILLEWLLKCYTF